MSILKIAQLLVTCCLLLITSEGLAQEELPGSQPGADCDRRSSSNLSSFLWETPGDMPPAYSHGLAALGGRGSPLAKHTCRLIAWI